MSISNKILIGFFGFIFIYLSSVFLEIRLTGTPNYLKDENGITETVGIGSISVLILRDIDRGIHVIGSDKPHLKVRSLKGDWLKKLNYKVSGDTLFMSGLQLEDEHVLISIFVAQNDLKAVAVNKAEAIIEGLHQDVLFVSQNAGRTSMSGNNINRVLMDMSDKSFLEMTSTEVDTLSTTIDASELYISSPVGLLHGSIKNKSYLNAKDIREIQLKKDESSRLNIYQ